MKKRSPVLNALLARHTPPKHQMQLVLKPRICLELLRQGQALPFHRYLVVGFLNLGAALAFLSGKPALQAALAHAQMALIKCDAMDASGHLRLPVGLAPAILPAVNDLDRLIGQVPFQAIKDALAYVNNALEGREASADVVSEADLRSTL